MNTQELATSIRSRLADIEADLARFQAEEVVTANDGPALASALLGTVPTIALVPGVTYPAMQIRRSVAILGNGATVAGATGSAVWVAPGVSDVTISDVTCTAAWPGAVVQLGDNTTATQGTLDRVPRRITLNRVTVPTHRGKRAFEVSAADVVMNGCSAFDVYHPSGQDSQGISILNTPGPVTVNGGTFQAGSENIMIGGDTIKVPGMIQSDLTFDGVTLSKPESWKTDGVKRAPKNIFEVKGGRNVILRNSTLSGSWKSTVVGDPTQDGYAIVITPRNGLWIEGVLVENCIIERCGTGVQFLGKDNNSVTPHLTSSVVFRNCQFTVSRTAYNGRNWFALYVDSMQDSLWENCTISHEGAAILFVDSPAPTGQFTMCGCTVPAGQYGIQAPGANYGNVGTVGRELAAVLEGNTLDLTAMASGGRTAFKANFPLNAFTP